MDRDSKCQFPPPGSTRDDRPWNSRTAVPDQTTSHDKHMVGFMGVSVVLVINRREMQSWRSMAFRECQSQVGHQGPACGGTIVVHRPIGMRGVQGLVARSSQHEIPNTVEHLLRDRVPVQYWKSESQSTWRIPRKTPTVRLEIDRTSTSRMVLPEGTG